MPGPAGDGTHTQIGTPDHLKKVTPAAGPPQVVMAEPQRTALSTVLTHLAPTEDSVEFRIFFLEQLMIIKEQLEPDVVQLTWVPPTEEMKRMIEKIFWDSTKKPPLAAPTPHDIIDMYRGACAPHKYQHVNAPQLELDMLTFLCSWSLCSSPELRVQREARAGGCTLGGQGHHSPVPRRRWAG